MAITPEQRHAGEQRVFDAYTAELMHAIDPPPGHQPIWPLPDGRIRSSERPFGIFAESTRLEGAWPDTVIVIVYRLVQRPGCRFERDAPLWDLDTLDQPEPEAEEFFLVNLWETIVTERVDCAPGELTDVGRHTPWSQLLPSLADGSSPATPEERTRAQRTLALLRDVTV